MIDLRVRKGKGEGCEYGDTPSFVVDRYWDLNKFRNVVGSGQGSYMDWEGLYDGGEELERTVDQQSGKHGIRFSLDVLDSKESKREVNDIVKDIVLHWAYEEADQGDRVPDELEIAGALQVLAFLIRAPRMLAPSK